MTSYELGQEIDDFLDAISSHHYLNQALEEMADSFGDVVGWFTHLLDGSSSLTTEHPKTIHAITSRAVKFRQLSARRLFREVDEVEAALTKIDSAHSLISTDLIKSLQQKLNDFASSYEGLIQESTTPGTIRTLFLARELNTVLQSLTGAMAGFRLRLWVGEPEHAENRRSLSLLLHPNDEVRVLVAKVSSLEVIYEEICRLLNVSTSEYPLEIAKIESGSPLWIKLFGESKVIGLVTDLIRDAIDYRYRNFTRDGELGSIPRPVDEPESVLNLEVWMADLGYDTTNMREDNQKSGAVIAKELNTLLSGETEVVVNGEVFSFTSVVDKLLADKGKTLLLEDGSADPEEPSNGGNN